MGTNFLLVYLGFYLILTLVCWFYTSYFFGVLAVLDKRKWDYVSGQDIQGDFFIRQKIWIRFILFIFQEVPHSIPEINKHKRISRYLVIIFLGSTLGLFFIVSTF